MNLNRRHAGWIAKKRGDQFQGFFERACHSQDITCVRIPDGCRQLGQGKILRVRTPFDYILAQQGQIVFVDLKAIDSDRISHSQIVDHQLESLSVLGAHSKAGYICFFRKIGKFVFFNVDTLRICARGDSLKWDHGLYLGDLLKADFGLIFGSD